MSTRYDHGPVRCFIYVFKGLGGLIFTVLFLFLTSLPHIASAQEIGFKSDQNSDCEGVITKAESLFFNAEFETAVSLLRACLKEDDIVDAEQAEIYLLLARIFFAEQKETDVAEALEHLFALNPDYTLDTHLPPPFVTFANHIREIYEAEEVLDVRMLPVPPISEEKKINNKRWFLIGGSSVVALTAIAIMAGGNSPTPDNFAPPPAPPSGQ